MRPHPAKFVVFLVKNKGAPILVPVKCSGRKAQGRHQVACAGDCHIPDRSIRSGSPRPRWHDQCPPRAFLRPAWPWPDARLCPRPNVRFQRRRPRIRTVANPPLADDNRGSLESTRLGYRIRNSLFSLSVPHTIPPRQHPGAATRIPCAGSTRGWPIESFRWLARWRDQARLKPGGSGRSVSGGKQAANAYSASDCSASRFRCGQCPSSGGVMPVAGSTRRRKPSMVATVISA